MITKQTQDVRGKRPHDMKIFRGENITIAEAQKPGQPHEILIGVIDSNGRETAVVMSTSEAQALAKEIIEYAQNVRAINVKEGLV